MREIKFRARARKDKCMINDVFLWAFDSSYVIWNKGSEDMYVDDFDWMQYTGFKDKNWKEIYEGDIVKRIMNNGIGRIDCVVFYEWMWCVNYTKANLVFNVDSDINYAATDKERREIIGNMYENKDLIPKKQND